MKKSLHKLNKLLNKKVKTAQKKVKKIAVRNVKPMKIKSKFKTKVKAKIKIIKPKAQAKTKSSVAVKPVVAKAKVKTGTLLRPKVQLEKKYVPVETNLSREQTVLGPVNVKPYQPSKNEEYMNKKQLEHFRSVLLKWKSQLMAEVDRTMHHMQDEVSNYPDPVDRASQEEEFNLELRARDRERKLSRKIDETLSRINDNDYGYCDDCGAEIGIRRLEARPTATQCIECKTIAEIREKQVGEGG